MRYDLPETRVRSKAYLVLPTVILFSVLLVLFFGSVFVIGTILNMVGEFIESLL